MQIVIAILAFCVIIIIHELGHFTAAKLCGIQVNEFAVGMGPVILRKKGRETNYVIRLLPIGGSVSMEGEQDSSDNPRAFNRKPVWQRMIVILAGPIMNLIFCRNDICLHNFEHRNDHGKRCQRYTRDYKSANGRR